MIILPEREAPRGKLLLPMRPREWRQPSQRTTTFGIENQTRWRLTARLHDGHIVWRGWFDDRDDADAFLWALACGTLQYEPGLWRLPVPAWMPGLCEEPIYCIDTVTLLTASAGSNQTYSVPADWSATNQVEAIGGGGSGGPGQGAGGLGGAGGSGAAWAKSVNLTGYSAGNSVTYQIGLAAGDSWWGNATFPVSGQAVGAKAGSSAAGTTGQSGGPSASCYKIGTGSAANSGGASQTTAYYPGSSGGGAGGPNGVGGAGAASISGNFGGAGGGGNGGGSAGSAGGATNGGDGGNNSASVGHGTGGTTGARQGTTGSAGGGPGGGYGATLDNSPGAATAGSAGTEWDATHGSGSGASSPGGANTTTSPVGANGGLYGGGASGGGGNGTALGGTGAQGIIVVTYTPAASSVRLLALLGVG